MNDDYKRRIVDDLLKDKLASNNAVKLPQPGKIQTVRAYQLPRIKKHTNFLHKQIHRNYLSEKPQG